MSKEYLEALETLKDMLIGNGVNDNINDYVDNLILPIKQALLELKSIKEANPSEALECLEDIYRNGVFISEVSFTKQHPTIRSPETNKTIGEQCDTIKQALIKEQEPKHYLKWEDLEFKKEEQRLKVKMGDNFYEMEWVIDGFGANVVSLYKYITNDYLVYCACIRYNNQQFFNDLHLERVEE